MTLKEFFRTPHDRINKQAIRVGCFSGQMVDGTQTGGSNKPGHWGVDTFSDWAFGVGGAAGNDREITSGYSITNVAATTPQWRLYLEDLFPILYNNNLPFCKVL